MLIAFFKNLIKVDIARSTNAAVVGISKSRLDATIFQSEIQISNPELFRYDRNRNGAGVSCFITNDIGYLQNLISEGNRKYFC